MGSQYTKAQAAAAKKYHQQFDEIKIRVPKGGKEEWQAFVHECGFPSMNDFVIQAMERYKMKINEEFYRNSMKNTTENTTENTDIIIYRGCEARKENKVWNILINGEMFEKEDCRESEVIEYIDSILDK